MQEERFWLLASCKLSGEASPEEEAELQELLNRHPEMALRLEIFTNIWRQQHPDQPSRRKDAFNKHLQRLSTHLSNPVLQYENLQKASGSGELGESAVSAAATTTAADTSAPGKDRSKTTIYKIFAGAAAVAACLAIVFFFVSRNSRDNIPDTAAFNTVTTRPGSKTKVRLPDGTQVFLNADSRLVYKEGFSGSSREVRLTGEAYFDVAKDAGHPFIIHTPDVDIRVLGTAFNVRSYGNERNTTTALFQGSVEVTLHNNPDKKIILKPNEKLIVRNNQLKATDSPSGRAPGEDPEGAGDAGPGKDQGEDPLMILGKVHYQKKDSSITETLWTKNQLAFDGATLEEVAGQIERWYDVKVHITNDRLKNFHFTAIFEDESLAQVMDALHISGNFTYTIHKKEVIISP